MLNFIFGPTGSGKTEYVYSKIKTLIENNQSNIIMLVPEQSSFECEKRIINLFGASSNDKVEVLSFTRLVNLFEVEFGSICKDAADNGIKLVTMQRAIKSVKPLLSTYSKSCSSVEFANSILALITELKQSNINIDMLNIAADKTKGTCSNKTRDIALIYSAYESMLSDNFKDPLDGLSLLSSKLEQHKYFKDKIIFIDSFEFFTEQQYEIISKMILQSKEVYITLCTDGAKTDEFGLFANVNKIKNRLIFISNQNGVDVKNEAVLDTTQRYNNNQLKNIELLLRTGEAEQCDGENVVVCNCRTAYEECDFVARTIKKLVRTKNYRFKDFAVIARDMNNYSSILCDCLDKYQISYFSDKRVELDSLILIRYIINALDSVCNNYRSEYFLSYIKSPLCPLSVEQAGELDNYIYIWNKKGRAVLEPFLENPDGADSRTNEKEKLKLINAYREKAVENLIMLEDGLKATSTKSRCKAIYEFLNKKELKDKLNGYCKQLKESNQNLLYDITVKSWDVLMNSLDVMLKCVKDDEIALKEWVELYKQLLCSFDIGHVPSRIDEVVIGSADRIRTSSPKITFVIGAVFGEFPRFTASAGLFSSSDRKKLIESGLKISDYSLSSVIDEKFYVYNAVCSPSDKLYITYHNSNLKGNLSNKSQFVTDIEQKIGGVKTVLSSDWQLDKFESALSALELVLKPEFNKYSQSLAEYFEKTDSEYKDISLKNFDSDLDKDTALKLYGKDICMSASKIETFSKCPFSFFCRYGINAKDLKTAELDVRQKGSLIHFVLEKIIKKYQSNLINVKSEDLINDINQAVDEYLNINFENALLTESFVFMINKVKHVARYLLEYIGEELAQSDFKPVGFEQPIGQNSQAQFNIELKQGSMQLNGSVDRVDIYEKDGVTYVRVIDYKTGSKTFDLSDVMYGLNMQMLIYLFALTQSPVFDNAKEAGVLYFPSNRKTVLSDRTKNLKEIVTEQKKANKMNGLVLKDKDIAVAMDKRDGEFIPFSSNSRRKNSCATEKDFDNIKNKVKSILYNIGNKIHEGEISVKPLDGTDSPACKYCDYKTVCRREPTEENKKVEKMDLEKILCLIDTEVQNGTD